MKNLAFILWGLFQFRLRKQGRGVAIVLNRFVDDESGRVALARALELYGQGIPVWVLCAFNDAPTGVQLPDYRMVYIFNNDPVRLAQFCAGHGVGRLEYAPDCTVMRGAAARFGLQVAALK